MAKNCKAKMLDSKFFEKLNRLYHATVDIEEIKCDENEKKSERNCYQISQHDSCFDVLLAFQTRYCLLLLCLLSVSLMSNVQPPVEMKCDMVESVE